MNTRVPYFHVYVGHRPDPADLLNGASASFYTTEYINYEKGLNSCIDEVTVTESQEGAPKFAVTIIDANMEYMFDENLFIGRYLFIDIGLQTPSDHSPKIDGFINNMKYGFTENGVPTLILEGFGTMWDALTKSTEAIGHKYDGLTVLQILHLIGDKFGLIVDEGITVPKDIDTLLMGAGAVKGGLAVPKNIGKHNQNAYSYLNSLAKYYGCIFFIHGRELHFYPASWIDSPISRSKVPVDLTHSLQGLVGKKVMSFWYKMDNTIAGQSGTGYNLLSFEPEVTDLNMAGYYGMSMDADSGEISFSTNTLDMGEMGKSVAVNGSPDIIPVITNTGVAITPKNSPMSVDGSSLSGMSKLTKTHTVVAERSSSTIPSRRTHPGPAKTMDELTAIAKYSFRKSMWFAKASATVLGDHRITCAIPVYIFGLGRRNTKTNEVLHNEKICGKWYVYTVEHKIKRGQDYVCSLDLHRFLQPIKPFTASDITNTTAEGAPDRMTLIKSVAGPGGVIRTSTDLPPTTTPKVVAK